MPYRAQIVFDFVTPYDSNALQRMECALTNIGWRYVGTSAFIFDQNSQLSDAEALSWIWQGVATFARGTAAIGGSLRAFTYTIQLIDTTKLTQTEFGGAKNPDICFADISTQIFPGDNSSGN